MATPLLVRKTLVLAKVETAEGEDPTPTGANNALLVSAATPTVNSEQIERSIFIAHLSRLGTIQGITTGQLAFTTELRGISDIPTAVAPLREDPLFRACGMSPTYATSSAFYQPISTGMESCTLYTYLDGALFVMLGCRGNFEITAETGQYGAINWTMQGMLVTLTSGNFTTGFMRDATVASASAAYQAFSVKPPPVFGVALSLDGDSTTFVCQSFTMNMNNEIQQRLDMTEGGGVKSFMLTGRNPQGTLNPEAVTRTDYDFWYKWQAAGESILDLTIGTLTENKVRIYAPAVQYGVPAWGERNGMRTFEMPLSFNADTDAGNDELKIMYVT